MGDGIAGATGSTQSSGAPLRVFLSYRRSDDINIVGRFHDHLVDAFGEGNVFRDLDSLHGGSNFPRVIKEEIKRIDAVVAMIGPTWSARLRQPGDFVALEIGEALERGCPVVPVLIQDAELPRSDELPEQLHGLLEINGVWIRKDPDFKRDAARAIDDVRRVATEFRDRTAGGGSVAAPPAEPEPPVASADPTPSDTDRRRWIVLGAGAALVLGAVVVLLVGRDDSGGGASDETSTSESTVPDTTGSVEDVPVDCQGEATVQFCDAFEGDSLDQSVWTVFENEGTVVVADGSATLSSAGASFPFVVTSDDPFPESGPYRLTIGYRFGESGTFGTGVWVHQGRPENGGAVGAVDAPPTAKIWEDAAAGPRIESECGAMPIESDDESHVAEFDYSASGDVLVSLDGQQIASCTGSLRPDVLWFGNPTVPDPCDCPWTTVSVEFVRIEVPT